MTLGINIAYVFIERSLPKEARIVTGLQVARRAHRPAAEPQEKQADGFAEEVERPLTPFSKDHFKFVAISIKAIPAAFCKCLRSALSYRFTSRVAPVLTGLIDLA